jgi:nucleoside-diphosphate-sugar epimerase
MYSHADISAARAQLGFEPAVPFEESLERTARRHKERS